MGLADIECFVFDMDGTINLGETPIPGARELMELLAETGRRYFYFTNNSSKSPEEYIKKLERLGMPRVKRSDIMTSGDVMIHYLKTHFAAPRVYLLGTPPLHAQLKEAGIETLPEDTDTADAVVLGFDTSLHYEKLNTACRLISHGVPFLATNIDRVCPLEGDAFLPDCGSMAELIRHATGVSAKFVGKPFAETVNYVLAAAGTPRERTAIVGDRLYTDIKTAKNGGIKGICVLSGEVSLADIEASDVPCDYILDSVYDIYKALL